jgi:AcrR family transcriptional regulator
MIPKAGRGKRGRAQAEARSDDLLDAALELFTKKGFAETRVEEIAARAGVSKGTVYLYFPSKEEVIYAIVRRAVTPIADHALKMIGGFEGDPRVAITLVAKMLGAKLADPEFTAVPRLIIREVQGFPGLAEMYRREVLDRMIPGVEALIQRGIDQGYLRRVDPGLTIRSVVGPIFFHVVMAKVFGLMPQDGLALDRLIDNHLAILFDGLSAPGSGT